MRRIVIITALCLLGSVILVPCTTYWVKYRARAKLDSKLSDINVLHSQLLTYAENHGSYPTSLSDLPIGPFVTKRIANIVYVGAGKAWRRNGIDLLLYENEPTEYLSDLSGAYVIYEDGHWLVPAEDIPPPAARPGGQVPSSWK